MKGIMTVAESRRGAFLRLPEDQIGNLEYNDLVVVTYRKALWYDLINWEKSRVAYGLLPASIKQKIADAGIPHP